MTAFLLLAALSVPTPHADVVFRDGFEAGDVIFWSPSSLPICSVSRPEDGCSVDDPPLHCECVLLATVHPAYVDEPGQPCALRIQACVSVGLTSRG